MGDDYDVSLSAGWRLFAAGRRQSSGIVIVSSKWSTGRGMQYSLLVALAFFFIYCQNAVLSSKSSFTQATLLVEKEEIKSFLMPERSGMRYPKFGNMTAAEKVASDYVVRDKSDYDPLANCSVTSQARIIQKSPHWILQSVDANGNDKAVGGDEFYVSYTDNRRPKNGKHTAAALITDLENGSYALDFVTTPMDPVSGNITGLGTLTVQFEYTCNIGRAHQPMKADWKFGGATLIHHSKSNITQPPIRAFQFPPSDIDFSPFDLVVSFGDSLMETFVRDSRKRNGQRVHRKKVKYEVNPMMELNSTTLDAMLEKMEEWHGKQHLRNSAIDVALLLGSSAWDITEPHPNATRARPEFSDHLDTCRRFVLKVQALYPNVTVMWKAPAAMVRTVRLILHLSRVRRRSVRFHVFFVFYSVLWELRSRLELYTHQTFPSQHLHNVDVTGCSRKIRCIRRLPYCSNSRVKYLYDEQIKIMKELNVPVLDVFESSYLSADQHPTSDVMHFHPAFNKLILSSFYKGGTKGNRTR
jgi:hypothetical protein